MAIEQTFDPGARSTEMEAIASSVVVLHGYNKTPSDVSAAKLVEFMGGRPRFVRLVPTRGAKITLPEISQASAVIVHARTLASAMVDCARSESDWLSSIIGLTSQCFIYGFEDSHACYRLLDMLTRGKFRLVEKPARATQRISVTSEERDLCRQLSGLSFEAKVTESDGYFFGDKVNGEDSCATLMLGGARPFLVRTNFENSSLMLQANSAIADPDDVVEGRAPIAGLFSRLAPLLIFLKSVGGEKFWQGKSSRACFIIDDPLLKQRYGFLSFEKLLAVLRQEECSASIAFIPWNYRRSNSRVVSLFREFPDHLSLAVHGCDHTQAEFGSTSADFLRAQVDTGMYWMAQHKTLTEVGWDRVMVFPQGHFSTIALRILDTRGYLAAVNSTGQPNDARASQLKLRDLLDVAVVKYGGVPLFIRHYPDDLVGAALDLFLGKPALLTEHHGFFKDGYESFVATVRELKRLEPDLEWTRLADICSSSCRTRKLESGDVLVRFYCDRFSLRNDTSESQTYLLQYRQWGSSSTVKLNGVSVDRPDNLDGIVARVELEPDQVVSVQVDREIDRVAESTPRRTFAWRAKVCTRRLLSEFRDNHLDRHPLLKRFASGVKDRLIRSI